MTPGLALDSQLTDSLFRSSTSSSVSSSPACSLRRPGTGGRRGPFARSFKPRLTLTLAVLPQWPLLGWFLRLVLYLVLVPSPRVGRQVLRRGERPSSSASPYHRTLAHDAATSSRFSSTTEFPPGSSARRRWTVSALPFLQPLTSRADPCARSFPCSEFGLSGDAVPSHISQVEKDGLKGHEEQIEHSPAAVRY